MRLLSRLSFLIFGTTLLSACASAPATAPGLASLELENQSHTTVRVSLNGRVEATLEPGTRQRVRYLAPRTHHLSARDFTSGETLAQSALSLDAGKQHLWVIPPEAGKEPLLAPAFATLKVLNPSSHDLELLVLDALTHTEVARAVLAPQAEHTFDELTQGEVLVLFRLDGTEVARQPYTLGSQPQVATFTLTRAPLRLLNSTTLPLTLSANGLVQGTVAPSTETTFYLPEGWHHLVARDELGRFSQEDTRELHQGQSDSWHVGEKAATLHVRNQRKDALNLRLNGPTSHVDAIHIDAGAAAELKELKPGVYTLQALDASGQLTFQSSVQLNSGTQLSIEIPELESQIQLVNTTSSEAFIYRVDGKGRLHEVARLPPQARRRLSLEDSFVSLKAVLALSNEASRLSTSEIHQLTDNRSSENSFQLDSSSALMWELTAPEVSLEVRNERSESITVFLNGARRASIAPHSQLVLTGIPVDAYRVELVGDLSRHAHRETLALTLNGAHESGHHIITATEAPKAGPSPHANTAPSQGSGSSSPGSASSHVASQAAVETALSVQSLLEEDVALSLNGDILGIVAPGQFLRFESLVAGPSTLQTVGVKSTKVRAHRLELVKGKTVHFVLKAPDAKLVIENRAPYPIELKTSRGILGEIPAHQSKVFGGFGVGTQPVELIASHVNTREQHHLEFLEGDSKRLTFQAPHAMLRVQGLSGDSYRLYINDALLAEIPQSDSLAVERVIAVPSGAQVVRVERDSAEGIRSVSVHPFDFKPNQLFDLALEPSQRELNVINTTPHPLSISLNQRALLTLAPSENAWLKLPSKGEILLEARDAQGRTTHLERLKNAAELRGIWRLTQQVQNE